ncbi:hypothetical protein [Pseudobutyrivibrio sp.]|jgi:hypothetical protein|uniref:hypothetical protein n=1 Tax=Pseudobutyrivibrio sp. TaxID=2014367 RepID=UPI001DEF706E|nr:hypothetical protein [Pseudobutyrivibrio sp.]MBE5911451.1 hypothetical protein [Pseudobutyrivibrio sp.]
MAIAPISGLSSYTPTASIQPMNYAVDNESDFSAVYNNESVKSGSSVTGAKPVQYPNARVEEAKESTLIDPTKMLEEKKRAASAFNEIAQNYATTFTGYASSGIGNSYGMAGSRFDAFA